MIGRVEVSSTPKASLSIVGEVAVTTRKRVNLYSYVSKRCNLPTKQSLAPQLFVPRIVAQDKHFVLSLKLTNIILMWMR